MTSTFPVSYFANGTLAGQLQNQNASIMSCLASLCVLQPPIAQILPHWWPAYTVMYSCSKYASSHSGTFEAQLLKDWFNFLPRMGNGALWAKLILFQNGLYSKNVFRNMWRTFLGGTLAQRSQDIWWMFAETFSGCPTENILRMVFSNGGVGSCTCDCGGFFLSIYNGTSC
jgi:hypothetical protein